MRKQYRLMTENNRTFFKDGLNRHQYYTDDEGDMHCIETFLNVYTTMLNEQQEEIKRLKKEIKRLTETPYMDIHQKCLDECAEKIEKDYHDGITEYKTELMESCYYGEGEKSKDEDDLNE